MATVKESKQVRSNDLNMNFDEVSKAYFVTRALNQKVRQKILNLIHKNKQMTVSEIYMKLKLKQSKTSTYLGILRKADIVIATRSVQSVYYKSNYNCITLVDKGAKIINKARPANGPELAGKNVE